MGKLIYLGGVTKLDINPDRVLTEAVGQMEGVVIMGFDKKGQVYTASSYADGGVVLWLIEKCKQRLLQSNEGE